MDEQYNNGRRAKVSSCVANAPSEWERETSAAAATQSMMKKCFFLIPFLEAKM